MRTPSFLPGATLLLHVALALVTAGNSAAAQLQAPSPPSAPPGPAAPAELSRDWKRITSPGLTVAGNAPERDLRRVLRQIEDFRAALAALFPGLVLNDRTPTSLVVLRDPESFRRFQPRDERGRRRENVGGFFLPAAHMNYMVLGAYGDHEATFETVFHEYTHFILNRNFHALPLWLSEGLADFYSTFRSNYKEGRSLLGASPTLRRTILRKETLLPLERILTNDGAAGVTREPSLTFMFYAESWALVHYLEVGNDSRQGQLGAYIRALERGLPVEQAFAASFHTTFEGMRRELESYLRPPSLPAILLDFRSAVAHAAPDAAATPLLEADAAYLQGDILTLVGATRDAEEALTRALALDAGHVDARIALARVRGQQDRRDEQIALLQAITAAEPSKPAAQLYLADALFSVKHFQDAVLASERAVALDQASPRAWYGLSLAALATGRSSQAEAAMLQVVGRDGDPLWHRTRVYDAFAFGFDEAVVRSANAYVTVAGWGNESSPYVGYASALASLRLGRQAEATATLEKVRASVGAGSWQDTVAKFLLGTLTAEQFVARANDDGERTEAHAYAGMLEAIAGRRDDALKHLRWVKEHGLRNYFEYRMALATLERLGAGTGSTAPDPARAGSLER